MFRKILGIAVTLMLFAGVVSASSINGDYKGNPIVKLKSNGSIVDTGDVPAMIYDGKTMVPIAALRNLGASVTWDQETYSAEVSISSANSSSDAYKNLSQDVEIYRAITVFNDQLGLASLTNNAILPYVSTKEQISSAIATVNRIDVDRLTNWLAAIKKLNISQTDYQKFEKATTNIKAAKQNMLKLDVDSATDYIYSAKDNINQLYFTYDDKIQSQITLK